jgi:hypothetical protein
VEVEEVVGSRNALHPERARRHWARHLSAARGQSRTTRLDSAALHRPSAHLSRHGQHSTIFPFSSQRPSAAHPACSDESFKGV